MKLAPKHFPGSLPIAALKRAHSKRCRDFHGSSAVAKRLDCGDLSPLLIRRCESGLTLIEILVSTALLLFISLGLTAMFNQTQRAFRSGVKQTDVLESGRAALDQIARDIQQAAASQSATNWNLTSYVRTNILAGFNNQHSTLMNTPDGTTVLRSNYLQEVFVLTNPSDWQGIGYRVLKPGDEDSPNFFGVGTLYRFSTNAAAQSRNDFVDAFSTGTPLLLIKKNQPNLVRVIDGVIHFQMKFYDDFGRQITNTIPNRAIGAITNNIDPNYNQIWFWGGDLPAMVEVELGILEPAAYEKLKPLIDLPQPIAFNDFLNRNAGKVHIFRQQVPIPVARQFSQTQ